MLKIRLTRRGKRNRAFFRIVVAEHTAPIKGRFIETLGFLNPHTKEKNLKADRVKHWLEKGAQCSDTVHNLLVKEGVVKGPKRAVKMKKKISEEKKEGVTEEKKEMAEETNPVEEEKKPEEKKEKDKKGKTEKIEEKGTRAEEKAGKAAEKK